MKRFYFILIIFILTCCATSSNIDLELQNNLIIKNPTQKDLNLDQIRLRGNFDIILDAEKNSLSESFVEGIQTSFFYYMSLRSSKTEISFQEITAANKDNCLPFNSSNKKIILISKKIIEVLKDCNVKTDNRTLFINLEKELNEFEVPNQINLFETYFQFFIDTILKDTFNDYIFLMEKKNTDEGIFLANKNGINPNNIFVIDNNSNFERKISEIFEIDQSNKRKREIERILGKKISFSHRYRKDKKNVIIETSPSIAERIIPAFRYNLLFDSQLYLLPKQVDVWLNKKFSDYENVIGWEHPILFSKIDLQNNKFAKLSTEKKLSFSLGFDSLPFLSRGFNSRYKGLLGSYSSNDKKIFVKPVYIEY